MISNSSDAEYLIRRTIHPRQRFFEQPKLQRLLRDHLLPITGFTPKGLGWRTAGCQLGAACLIQGSFSAIYSICFALCLLDYVGPDGEHDAHHGTLNAIVMPYVLVANRSAIEDDITDLTHTLGLPKKGFNAFLDWILGLRQELDLPNTLSDIGIDDDRAAEIGAMAVKDPTAATNPIAHDAAAYADILRRCVSGDL